MSLDMFRFGLRAGTRVGFFPFRFPDEIQSCCEDVCDV